VLTFIALFSSPLNWSLLPLKRTSMFGNKQWLGSAGRLENKSWSNIPVPKETARLVHCHGGIPLDGGVLEEMAPYRWQSVWILHMILCFSYFWWMHAQDVLAIEHL
jgi:hypothetical protein